MMTYPGLSGSNAAQSSRVSGPAQGLGGFWAKRRRGAVAAVLLGALLAACGKVPPVTPADTLPVDLQSVTSWKPEWAGRPISEAIGAERPVSVCMGFIDVVAAIGDTGQTRIDGWTWNTAAGAPFEILLVTDPDGKITGAGVTAVQRADVKAAFPAIVRHDRVGSIAFSASAGTKFTVHGMDQAGGTICAIGSAG